MKNLFIILFALFSLSASAITWPTNFADMDNFTASVSNAIADQVRAEFDAKIVATNDAIQTKLATNQPPSLCNTNRLKQTNDAILAFVAATYQPILGFTPVDSSVTNGLQTIANTPTTNTLLPSALAASTYQPLLPYQPATNGAAVAEAQVTGLVSDLAAKQPLDSDLTSVAALATTSFGRSFLTQSDAAGSRSYIGAGTSSFDGAFSSLTGKPTTISGYGITDSPTTNTLLPSALAASTYQPLDSDLTSVAALATTSFGRSFLTQADASSSRSYIGAGTSSFDGVFASLTSKPTTISGYGITDAATTNTLTPTNSAQLITMVEKEIRVFRSPTLTCNSTFAFVSNSAYFVYIGRVAKSFTPQAVEFHVSTAGAGTQLASEIGLFSTPLPPNKTAQTLTTLTYQTNITALTSTGVKKNTTVLATSVAAGTYLWAGVHLAMATTQPTCVGLSYDLSEGNVLVTAGAASFTNSTFSGALIAVGTATIAPEMRITLDP